MHAVDGDADPNAAAGGIWRAASLAATHIPEGRRLTLREGGTPLEPFASDPLIVLKREDRNPTGSHKARAAAYQLARAATSGVGAVTISSSGNAGVATATYAGLHGLRAYVCVHPATDLAMLAAIGGATTTLVVTARAINTAKLLARELGIPNLRPSTHDDALVGYRTLGDELAAARCDAVVLFATSGATAIAVAERLHELRPGLQVHFVQGEGNAALADPTATITDASAHGAAAGRLGVRRSRRARALLAAIATTGGRGHVVTAAQVAQAGELLRGDGIEVGAESAANLVVACQLAAQGMRVACIISGARPPVVAVPATRIDAADEHEALAAVRAALGQHQRLSIT